MSSTLTVTYVTGDVDTFDVEIEPRQGTEATGLRGLVEHPNLVLLLEGELLMIPGSAIKHVSLKLPPGTSVPERMRPGIRARRRS